MGCLIDNPLGRRRQLRAWDSNRKNINRQAHDTKLHQMATHDSDISRVLQLLDESSAQSLSIVKLTEPLLGSGFPRSPSKNAPDASTVSNDTAELGEPTPATLEADLNHYKVIFSFAIRPSQENSSVTRSSSQNFDSLMSSKSQRRSFSAPSLATLHSMSDRQRMRTWRRSCPASRRFSSSKRMKAPRS